MMILENVYSKKGYCFVGSDYSQQEPRILAQLVVMRAPKQAYKDGKDYYKFSL